MKRFLIIILISLSASSWAQFGQNNAIYVNVGTNLIKDGLYLGITGVNYIYKQKYGLQFQFVQDYFVNADTPEDYFSVAFGTTDDKAYDQIDSYALTASRIFHFNNLGSMRLNLNAGISYNINYHLVDFEKNTDNPVILIAYSNYKHSVTKSNGVGLVINPQFEIPIFRIIGLRFGLYTNINKFKTFYGANLGILIGLLKARKHKKHH